MERVRLPRASASRSDRDPSGCTGVDFPAIPGQETAGTTMIRRKITVRTGTAGDFFAVAKDASRRTRRHSRGFPSRMAARILVSLHCQFSIIVAMP